MPQPSVAGGADHDQVVPGGHGGDQGGAGLAAGHHGVDDQVGRVAAEGLLEGGVDAPTGGVLQLGERAQAACVGGLPGGHRHEDRPARGRLRHRAVQGGEAAQRPVESDDHLRGAGHGRSTPSSCGRLSARTSSEVRTRCGRTAADGTMTPGDRVLATP